RRRCARRRATGTGWGRGDQLRSLSTAGLPDSLPDTYPAPSVSPPSDEEGATVHTAPEPECPNWQGSIVRRRRVAPFDRRGSARQPLNPQQIRLNQRAGNGAGRRLSPVGRPSMRQYLEIRATRPLCACRLTRQRMITPVVRDGTINPDLARA